MWAGSEEREREREREKEKKMINMSAIARGNMIERGRETEADL